MAILLPLSLPPQVPRERLQHHVGHRPHRPAGLPEAPRRPGAQPGGTLPGQDDLSILQLYRTGVNPPAVECPEVLMQLYLFFSFFPNLSFSLSSG